MLCKIQFDLSDVVAIIALLVSVFSFIVSLKLSQRKSKYEILSDLLKEYRTYQFGMSLRKLWEFYNLECQQNEKILEKIFLEKYKQNDPINNDRRVVSHYFQQIALYYHERIIPMKWIRKIWTPEVLEIIPKILYPMEMVVQKYLQRPVTSQKILFMLDLSQDISENKEQR